MHTESNRDNTMFEPSGRRAGHGLPELLRASVGAVALCLLGGVVLASGQDPAEPQLARDYFLNVPDMGQVPVDEFMETMGMFASALGLNCADCHTFESSSSWAAYADETPIKQTTRRMIQSQKFKNRLLT